MVTFQLIGLICGKKKNELKHYSTGETVCNGYVREFLAVLQQILYGPNVIAKVTW